MTYGTRLPFKPCGFEFTAAKRCNARYLYKTSSTWFGGSCYDMDSYVEKMLPKIQVAKWINSDTAQDDDDCLEIPTPIVKNRKEVKKYYEEFSDAVRKLKLTTDMHKADGLGGCHIHISLSSIPEGLKKAFIRNIYRFVTNYPELNWGFNDPNDNYNANCMLALPFNFEIRHLPSKDKQMIQKLHKKTNLKFEKRKSEIRSNYHLVSHFNQTVTNKQCAINYREAKNTMEFRFFDMPNSLERHLLHVEVAQKIFEYCKRMTEGKYLIFNKRSSVLPVDFRDYPCKEAIEGFKEAMKIIGINISRCEQMILNIETRYEWQNQPGNSENYLQ